MTGQVQGKVALVTGGASGIGAASSYVTGTELVIDGGMNAGGAVRSA